MAQLRSRYSFIGHLRLAGPVALALAVSACGQPVPVGEAALREIIPAVTGQGPEMAAQRIASDFADNTISFGSGFADAETKAKWSQDNVRKMVATRFAPYNAMVADSLYTDLADKFDDELIGDLMADIRDPARLEAIRCAYKVVDGKPLFAWTDCNTDAFPDDRDFQGAYDALIGGQNFFLQSPVPKAAFGSVACNLVDEFSADVKKTHADFELTGVSYGVDSKAPTECAEFRELAAKHLPQSQANTAPQATIALQATE
jgi:hypothetical protein